MGDCEVSHAISSVQCSNVVQIGRGPCLRLNINVTATFNELFRDVSMPIFGRDVQRCSPIFCLKIQVTASFNQLVRNASMSMLGSDVQRCGPIFCLKIQVTTSFNQQLRDGHLSLLGSDEERVVSRIATSNLHVAPAFV
jgi:hypothetical protein